MKTLRPLIFVCLILFLSACRPAANAPTQQNSDDEPAATPEMVWDERDVYAATLTPTSQDVLEQFPLASEYHIELDIPDDLSQPFSGRLQVKYSNQESQPLDEIIFRLFANYNGGVIIVSEVEVDQTPADTSLEAGDTTLAVQLSEQLEAGDSVMISMDFSMSVPTEFGGNYGLLSFIDEILVLDLFYPMIPAYDEDGWYREYPSEAGDLSYNDIAFYQVQVSAPEKMVLVATGSQISKIVEDGRQVVSYTAGPVRDFFLAGSEQFTLLTAKVGDTTLNSYALPGNELHQQYVLDFLQAGMSIFEELFGSYPYTEFDVVSSPMQALGIEYPGIVGIFKDLYIENSPKYGSATRYILEMVVIHELAHQWFYGIVGNDQQELPWVDESITQYSVYLYTKGVWGNDTAEMRVDEWRQRVAPLEDPELPIGMAVSEYGRAYSAIIYGRGPLFYYQLEELLGEDILLAGLTDYSQKNRWGIANTESIQESLEAACECDLSGPFAEWVNP